MDQTSHNSKSSSSAPQHRPQQATQPERPFNAGDPKSVAAAEKRKRIATALRNDGLRELMASKAGRAWMYWLLAEMSPMRNAFTGNSQTFFNCGLQLVGQQLLAELLEHHLDAYVTMCKEHRADARPFQQQDNEETEED